MLKIFIFPHFPIFSPCFLIKNSLFKVQVSNTGGDSSNADDHTGSRGHAASRPQTFHSQVTMVTVPPPLQLPQATVSLAVPPPSPQHHFSPLPPMGSSAASSRPLQQAALAKMQDKGTKRAFVPPMTPQPLRIQGAALSWLWVRAQTSLCMCHCFTTQFSY